MTDIHQNSNQPLHAMNRLPRKWAALALAGFALSLLASRAAEFEVPSDDYPTLTDAITVAAANNELNHINIVTNVLRTTAEVFIGAGFNAVNRLVIRPGAGLRRAVVLSGNGLQPAFRLFATSDVTIQDLEILRNSTNARHLMDLNECTRVVLQRCRLGSIWSTTGTPGNAVIYVTGAHQVVVRNCICFATTPGTFDYGIWGQAATANNDYLLLYHNDVADYAVAGIRLQGGGNDTVFVLRNNIVANHPAAPSEPYAFISDVPGDVPVVYTSHNTAFASTNRVELQLSVREIAGQTASFLRHPANAQPAAFMLTTWFASPLAHPNPTFFRLINGGLLHTGNPAVQGQTLSNGGPEWPDLEVADDIESQLRPSGATPHTDRGADQIEVDVYLIAAQIVGQGIRLNFNGAAGRTFGIEAANTLPPQWQRIGSAVINPAGQGQFTNTNVLSSLPRRFYRTVFP
jgi:hypothetical protein